MDMKIRAKVIKTGKIVNVWFAEDRKSDMIKMEGARGPIYEDQDGNLYTCEDLDFNDIHPNWEQIKIQASIAAMQGIISTKNQDNITSRDRIQEIANASVEYANALIERLKKEIYN